MLCSATVEYEVCASKVKGEIWFTATPRDSSAGSWPYLVFKDADRLKHYLASDLKLNSATVDYFSTQFTKAKKQHCEVLTLEQWQSDLIQNAHAARTRGPR